MSHTAVPIRQERRLAGVTVRISCGDARLFVLLDPWLDFFLLEADPAGGDEADPRLGLTLDAVDVAPPPPAGLEPLVEYYYVSGFRRGPLFHFRTAEGAFVELDAATGDATGAVPRSMLAGPPWAIRDLFNAAFTTFLRERGRYPLHGAALHGPAGGLVIVGSAMAGKTTLSLNLARRGWAWLADDKILLSDRGPGAPWAAGLLTHANIDPALERWFPELAGLAERPPVFAHTTKRAVRLAELGSEAGAGAPVPLTLQPGWLLFPALDDSGRSRVEPLTAADAFLELIRQSPLVSDRRAGRRQLDLLGRLARGTRAFRLRAARDLLEDPERLSVLGREMDFEIGPPKPIPPRSWSEA